MIMTNVLNSWKDYYNLEHSITPAIIEVTRLQTANGKRQTAMANGKYNG